MVLVRRHLYVGGRPPADWDEGRDVRLCQQLLVTRAEGEIAAAIEGFGALRDKGEVTWCQPGTPATMRCLRNTRSGLAFVFDLAQREFWQQNEGPRPRQGAPTPVAELLRFAGPRGPDR